MESFEVSTAQNVSLNYEIATVGDRILASIIDTMIKAGYLFLIAYLLSKTTDDRDRAWWMLGLFMLPIFLYTLLFEIFMEGQTPGKKVRKIKVARLDGNPTSIGAYLLRWLLSIIEANILILGGGIGIVAMILSPKCQRLGDMLAGTTVIKTSNSVALRDTLYEKVNSNYQPVYPEAKLLTSADVELIKQVLNNSTYLENFEMVYTLTGKVQQKMNVSRTEGPEDFLRTVIKDYNHLCDE
ncbi:MAG: hypothetical protein RLZZ367_481 [Bacteroidota bacterium]|jgi:uncharacterized RDD family membrane protein YckC